jgi:cell wall-associated NlpC family hydrolase
VPRRLSNLLFCTAALVLIGSIGASYPARPAPRMLVRVAEVVAPVPAEVAAAPSPAASAPSDAAPRRQSVVPIGIRVVTWAVSQVGKPYAMGATGPWAYDCSGLALSAWHSVGVDLPRVASDQYGAGPHVPLAEARPGDLVFFGGWSIFHVGIYAGDMMMVEAPHSGGVVQVVPITTDGPPLAEVTRPAT